MAQPNIYDNEHTSGQSALLLIRRAFKRRGPSLEPFETAEDFIVEKIAPSRVACLAIRSDGKHELSTCERTVRNLASYVTDT